MATILDKVNPGKKGGKGGKGDKGPPTGS